jgi:Flp pilus assembly pilin Flp
MDRGQSNTEGAVLLGLIVVFIIAVIVLFPDEVRQLSTSLDGFLRRVMP